MGTIYQMTEEILKGDPYIGVWNQALETVDHLCLITDYCKAYAFNLGIQPCITSAKQALGMNRNKRNGHKLKIHVTSIS